LTIGATKAREEWRISQVGEIPTLRRLEEGSWWGIKDPCPRRPLCFFLFAIGKRWKKKKLTLVRRGDEVFLVGWVGQGRTMQPCIVSIDNAQGIRRSPAAQKKRH